MPYKILRLALLCATLPACTQNSPPLAPPAPPAVKADIRFKLVAGIAEIMRYEIDPSADALWDSVGTYVDRKGTQNRQPHTSEQWSEMRGHAIVLAEAANLLIMEGREVTIVGHDVEDSGTPGNLTAAQSQAAIDKNRAAFIGFAQALGEIAGRMIKATEDKNAAALLESGAALDEVCEGCHLKFWYPGQKIPPFPEQAPESAGASHQ